MYERIKVNTLLDFKDVLDIYTVDRYGNVYGTNGIELTKSFNSSGYLQVSLKVKDKRRYRKCFIHRIVAIAFVENKNPSLFREVDHIDTNKLNNCYDNLRWTDRKGNMANPLTKEKLKGINAIPCYVYDYRLNYIGFYDSLSLAENNLGITIHSVDSRVERFYILSKPDLQLVLKINRKQKLQSVVITDLFTYQKRYFYSNREARRFFDNKVNITDAIKNNWTVRGRYKVRSLNYKKLIGMLNL